MIIKNPEVLVPIQELDKSKMAKIERHARICYKSEDKMQDDFNPRFLKSILQRGHESVIEHEKASVLFIIDRGVSHELVRHRLASFSQESTRYCNYSQEKFGQEITVIDPYFFHGQPAYELWKEACEKAEENYFLMLKMGCSPQEARSILPNSLKTEIAVTFNMREWRHFFRLRCASPAHPQMRQVAIPLLHCFQKHLPELFGDIEFDKNFPTKQYGEISLCDDLFRKL